MHMFKKVMFWFGFTLLNVSLLLTLVTLPVSTHLTNRESIKNWVSDPEILNGILETIPTFLSDAIEDGDAAELVQVGEQVIGIDKEQLIEASSDVLTTEYISGKLFPVIDGVYDWLEGETDSPEFDVVLSDRLTALAQSVSAPLTSELAKLPACPSNLTYTTSFNPIDTPCVPQGTDVSFIVNEFTRELTSNSSDIADISFSSDELELEEEILTAGPVVYNSVSRIPYVFGAMAVILSVAVVFLADSWKKGLTITSWIFIGLGLLTTASYWVLGKTDLFIKFNSEGDEYNIFTDKIAEPFARIVLGDIASTGLKLSLATVALGVGMWLVGHIHGKVTHEQKVSANKPPRKIKDTSPTERQEVRYINKIAKK